LFPFKKNKLELDELEAVAVVVDMVEEVEAVAVVDASDVVVEEHAVEAV
jgi:hypothetical protein